MFTWLFNKRKGLEEKLVYKQAKLDALMTLANAGNYISSYDYISLKAEIAVLKHKFETMK